MNYDIGIRLTSSTKKNVFKVPWKPELIENWDAGIQNLVQKKRITSRKFTSLEHEVNGAECRKQCVRK